MLLMFLLLALRHLQAIVILFYFLSDFGNARAPRKRIERLLAEPELRKSRPQA